MGDAQREDFIPDPERPDWYPPKRHAYGTDGAQTFHGPHSAGQDGNGQHAAGAPGGAQQTASQQPPSGQQQAPGAPGSEVSAYIDDAGEYLEQSPPPDDPILPDLIDKGDKVFIVGQSKGKKTFFTLQLALCLAGERPFLGKKPVRPMRVLFIQFELRRTKCWKRIRKVAGACGITRHDLGGRLHVMNLRGKQFPLSSLRIEDYDVVIIDPFYKLTSRAEADENQSKDMNPILGKLDEIAERGPAVIIVHHGTKGRIGDKQTIDRASGSGVIARDFDAMFTLTPHRDHSDDWIVLESILRNYRSPDAQTIEFREGVFVVRSDVPPQIETSHSAKNNQQKGPSVEEISPEVAQWITGPMKTTDVTDRIRKEWNVGEKKANRVMRELDGKGFRRYQQGYPAMWFIAPADAPTAQQSEPPTQGFFNGVQ